VVRTETGEGMPRIRDIKVPPSRWRAVSFFLTMFGASSVTHGLFWGWSTGRDWARLPILPGIVKASLGIALWIGLVRAEWTKLKQDR
jgi:hypothetical protein